jgi:hypothetical protein
VTHRPDEIIAVLVEARDQHIGRRLRRRRTTTDQTILR